MDGPLTMMSSACACATFVLLLSCCSIARSELLGHGITWQIGQLQLTFYDLDVVRVVYCPVAGCTPKKSLVVIQEPQIPTIVVSQPADDTVELRSSKLTVLVNTTSYHIAFKTADGKVILQEPESNAKILTPRTDLGTQTFSVKQSFLSSDTEAIYGLGQYQNGLLNYKNVPIVLQHYNTEAAVPFYLSTQGYGILWDNYAKTIFNAPLTQIPLSENHHSLPKMDQKYDMADFIIPQGLLKTGTPVQLAATFTPHATGIHHFLAEVSSTWGLFSVQFEVKLNDTMVITYDGAINMPATMSGRVFLHANAPYVVSFLCGGCDTTSLAVLPPTNTLTTIESQVGDDIDYYFISSSSLNTVIAKYRQLTGAAPMYPQSAYGFWQCRERYVDQQELLTAAHQYRYLQLNERSRTSAEEPASLLLTWARGIPLDNMVQDWQWWYPDEWVPEWDVSRFPDPAQMVRELASINATLMVSVWSKFEYHKVVQMMQRDGLFIEGTNWFDTTNPVARERFYHLAKVACFNLGIPALWLDATEPEGWPHQDKMLAAGSGNRYFNTYSLQVAQAIYEGWTRDNPDGRFFSLTRSSFAGQQRYAAALWSGDILSTWETLRLQVPAGINFALSGMPYWTTDIGGFFRPQDEYASPAFHELLIRWFQFGAFCPLFRVHGAGTHTEIWNFGNDTAAAITVTHKLRYRLMPYIYSMAGAVTMHGYTIMRGLVLDFTHDMAVREITDQFMFGPAIMVAPVLYPNATSRRVYLPVDSRLPSPQLWHDFWTGEVLHANSSVEHPLKEVSHTPLFVRGGSILLMGPHLQYVTEKPANPIEVRVYGGGNSEFVLYEDDGRTNAYKEGGYTMVKFSWNDTAQVLSIGARQGGFPQMLTQRTFQVVFVRAGSGTGLEPAQPDASVSYNGTSTTVKRVPPHPQLETANCMSRACRLATPASVSST